MIGRFDRETRHLKHWSTVPFTVAAQADERDATFPAGTTLPGPTAAVRATADWAALEIDPEPPSPPPAAVPNTIIGYTIAPPTWIIGPAAADRAEARAEVVFRRHVGRVTITARRDGLLSFDFTEWQAIVPVHHDDATFDAIESLQGSWLDAINAHALCLVSAISEVQELSISKREVMPRDFVFGHGEAFSGPGLTALWGMRSLPPPTQVIEEPALLRSVELLEAVFQQRDLALSMVALLNRAACYCEERNFPLALVAGWTVSERLLHILGARLNLAKLREAAKIISEVGNRQALPAALLQRLTPVRKRRNDWLHAGVIVDWASAEEAVQTAREMIAHVLGIVLRLPLIRTINY